MNQVLEIMNRRHSVRHFESRLIEQDKLTAIIHAFTNAPTSINGQLVSLVIVKDQVKKDRLAELVGGQKHVSEGAIFMAFCLDTRRAERMLERANIPYGNKDTWDTVLTATYDCGSKMSHVMLAAESMGIHSVPIGSLRNRPEEVGALLELPQGVYPFCGLVLGYAHEGVSGQVKPKLPSVTTVFFEAYNSEHMDVLLDDFDEAVRAYNVERYKREDMSQTKVYQMYYEKPLNPDLEVGLRACGFLQSTKSNQGK